MTKTTVVHKRDHHDVYIGRPSKWGNPFSEHKHGRTECIKLYHDWILTGEGRHLLDDLHELQGKVLGCWCKPKACHGDVLAMLANKGL